MFWSRSRSVKTAGLLALCFWSVSWAAPHHDDSNWTRLHELNGSDRSASASSIAYPGPGWLERMGAVSDNAYTTADGIKYASAYDAILSGDPLGQPCRNVNAYINSFIFSPQTAATIVDAVGVEWGHYLLCYLRNFLGAMLVYYGTASIFHYFIYIHPQSEDIFKDRLRPTKEIMWQQIKVSQSAMFIYTMLPVFDEWLIEKGYTKMYFTVEEIGGWPNHIACMLLFFACVEIGIYWVHRTLHTNKTLYKYIHMPHHIYNRPETLTPWASIAFHPLDGIAQASPYVWVMPFVPCHYLCHLGLIFFTAIWATYIHDAMDWNIDPIMGPKYHTVHHTHYIYNYGQMLTFCDRFWGTYKAPDGPTGTTGKRKTKSN